MLTTTAPTSRSDQILTANVARKRAERRRAQQRRAMRLDRIERLKELVERDGPDSIWAELLDIDQTIEQEQAA